MHVLHKKLNIGLEDQMQQKIQVLKQTVYPKKKAHLSNNINRFAIRKSLPRLNFKEEITPNKQKCNSDRTSKESPEKLKKTTIEFRSVNLKNSEQKTPAWTAQGWYPSSKSAASLRTKKPISFREAGDIFQFERKDGNSADKSPKQQYKGRDTQTLLRKNSLFLLSFIRTRERKGKAGPHFGESPLVFEQRPRMSEMERHRSKSPKFDEQKQKKPQKKKPVPVLPRKQEINHEKYERPLYPEPW